jgi:hypothetical protein
MMWIQVGPATLWEFGDLIVSDFGRTLSYETYDITYWCPVYTYEIWRKKLK